MRHRAQLWIVLILGMLPVLPALANGAREDVVRIVRLMGYGAGIHHFKNYVLRQRAEDYTSAKENFRQILEIVTALKGRTELKANDQRAVAAIKAVVNSYNIALDRIGELRDQGWHIEDIDRAVIIDDRPAKAALDALRARWTWSDFEEMEFQLGYGKAIHNFKNYVLRGLERYHTEALENLLWVDALVTRQLNLPELRNPRIAAELAVVREGHVERRDRLAYKAAVDELEARYRQDRIALEGLGRVVRAYRNHLPLISRLISMQRPALWVDRAIKIYSAPGKDGLVHLREAGAYLFEPRAREFDD